MADAGDQLYAADLDAFITERSVLVKALRAEGDRATATEVSKLRKPTVAAWVLNQLARRAPDALAGILGAAAELRAATESGQGVREAIAAHRDALRAALAVARGFEPNGRPPSDAVMEKVRDTLAAAALDDTLAAALRSGRLVDDADPAAGGAAEADPVAAPPTRSKGPATGKRKRKTRQRGENAEAERAAARERRRAAEEERRREETRRRAAQARERRDRAREHLAETRSAATAADTRLEEARRALARAEKEHEAAHAAADDAAAALAEAEAALDRLDA